MPLDVDALRAQTPGVDSIIHLNNAGASLSPAPVVDAVTEYLQAEATTGGYELAEDRATDLSSVYAAAADLVGGRPDSWAFVESATRAWNSALSALRFQPGDRVITTTAEYPSNMAGLLRARELHGVEVVVAPDDEHGQVDVDALESLLDDRTRLVSLTHVPTQSGLVNPAARVGEMLAGSPILYQVDACQSVGQLPVNVADIGCDVLSFTGRKFIRGPRGTGMVWVSDRALAQMGNPAGVDMQGATWDAPLEINPLPNAGRLEPYEVFYAGKVGLGVALEYAAAVGIEEIAARNASLSGQLRDGLAALAGVRTHDLGADPSAIVTFTLEGRDATDVRHALRARGINVSVASVNSARLDFPRRGLTDVVRASVHYFNTERELDSVLDVVSSL